MLNIKIEPLVSERPSSATELCRRGVPGLMSNNLLRHSDSGDTKTSVSVGHISLTTTQPEQSGAICLKAARYTAFFFFFFFFFCVPMILASCQIWSPVALINTTVWVRLYSVPFSLSSRVEGFGQVCCLSSAWSGQSWRMCSAVWAILPRWQLGLVPILNFVCMCFFLRRLCPERRRNIMVLPSLLSLWYAWVILPYPSCCYAGGAGLGIKQFASWNNNAKWMSTVCIADFCKAKVSSPIPMSYMKLIRDNNQI